MALRLILATFSVQNLNGYQAPDGAPAAETGPSTESAPMNASQLQSLVAPIALYPDSLVGQVLTAATFPDQVAIAKRNITREMAGIRRFGATTTGAGRSCLPA